MDLIRATWGSDGQAQAQAQEQAPKEQARTRAGRTRTNKARGGAAERVAQNGEVRWDLHYWRVKAVEGSLRLSLSRLMRYVPGYLDLALAARQQTGSPCRTLRNQSLSSGGAPNNGDEDGNLRRGSWLEARVRTGIRYMAAYLLPLAALYRWSIAEPSAGASTGATEIQRRTPNGRRAPVEAGLALCTIIEVDDVKKWTDSEKEKDTKTESTLLTFRLKKIPTIGTRHHKTTVLIPRDGRLVPTKTAILREVVKIHKENRTESVGWDDDDWSRPAATPEISKRGKWGRLVDPLVPFGPVPSSPPAQVRILGPVQQLQSNQISNDAPFTSPTTRSRLTRRARATSDVAHSKETSATASSAQRSSFPTDGHSVRAAHSYLSAVMQLKMQMQMDATDRENDVPTRAVLSPAKITTVRCIAGGGNCNAHRQRPILTGLSWLEWLPHTSPFPDAWTGGSPFLVFGPAGISLPDESCQKLKFEGSTRQ
ncbi:hypothetical protein CPLU01_08237 [Colletotrichum plurivorum]|uniref:Uncharacterized protein n=1 Tax=Colletotrichum plurivorum TaxID=2175906 RepID=A0A8H6KDT3_9PEZI|nr:hypothetical protein CPLU01_08237 [Colletotrichum plurivorum]